MIGFTAARVQAIFQLPLEFGVFAEPLAFVEWFMPFNEPMANLEMHQVSWSTCRHSRQTSIIPINQIHCLLHLIPQFGRRIDLSWTADNILDKCEKYYVNPYVRHLDFVFSGTILKALGKINKLYVVYVIYIYLQKHY